MAKKDAAKGSVQVVRFEKIKWDSKNCKVNMHWIEQEESDQPVAKKEFHQEPKKRFKEAMAALVEHAADYVANTEAEKKKLAEQIEVRGVNFKLSKHGVRAQLIIVRRIPDGKRVSCINFNTPELFCYVEDDNKDLLCWPPEVCDTLDELRKAAEAYLNGDREPMSELTGEPESKDGGIFKGKGSGREDAA